MGEPLYHGVTWYPELWDEAIWRQDIQTMQELEINLVRIGDFIWSTVEPKPGQFDFSILHRAADALYAANIKCILSTSTAAAPVWFTHGQPQRCHMDRQGIMSHGSRLHVCINNPDYRLAVSRLLERLAKEMGRHPALIMWQIDNEIKSQVGDCLCDVCKQKWHQWLEKRYGDIQALNEAWITGIFSQTYQQFSQIPQPVHTPFLHNPALQTAYHRFSMESASQFAAMQAAVIRKYSAAPVTTDGSIGFYVDQSDMYRRLDKAAFTTYASQEHHAIYLMNHDYWRNIKPGEKHWLLETACLHAGHLDNTAKPLPKGYLAAEAAAAYALDSQSFCYWHLRQHRGGCEIGHSALLSAWGAKTAGWQEVQKVCAVKRLLGPLIDRTVLDKPEIAIFYSDIARAYFDTEKLSVGSYTGWIRLLHSILFEAGYPRDVITECAGWRTYRLVWTPLLPYMDAATLDRAEQFVRGGGTWISGPMTGHRTAEHGVPTNFALGELEARFGFTTKFIAPLHGAKAQVKGFSGHPDLCMWGFAFQPQGIQPLGYLQGGCMDGEIFFAERSIGKGKLILLGAAPAGEDGQALLRWMVTKMIADQGIGRPAAPSRGVEVIQRSNPHGKSIIAINMESKPGTVAWNGNIAFLQPYETKILMDETIGELK